MSKYYDLDKLKDMIEAKAETLIGDGAIAFHAVAKWLDYLPAADVVPVVHGEWIKMGNTVFICSVCDELESVQTPYCPICGAKMYEEEEK